MCSVYEYGLIRVAKVVTTVRVTGCFGLLGVSRVVIEMEGLKYVAIPRREQEENLVLQSKL